MNILYIGQYPVGSTSRMRGEIIKTLFPNANYFVIDTCIPFDKGHRISRSFTFRNKRGPLIRRINKYISNEIYNQQIEHYDLIWIDKAVFITSATTKLLKEKTSCLVHFTPDPAFTFHQSHHFRASLSLYNFAITTKAFELEHFKQYITEKQVLYTTQGFDKNLHQTLTTSKIKEEGLLFIGHCEKNRIKTIQLLIDSQIKVSIAGIKWEGFIKKNKNNPYLNYLGKGVYGQEYVNLLGAYQFSWGALSKWIPELHTTRTFEIPACGTALITERNKETTAFFNEDEAIFYNTTEEMINKIKYYQNHPNELKNLAQNGMKRVHNDGRDYESILREVIIKMGFKLN